MNDRATALIYLFEYHTRKVDTLMMINEDEEAEIEDKKAKKALKELQRIAYPSTHKPIHR